MKCSAESTVATETGQFACSICLRGVGSNSILCVKCKKWIHKNCSAVKGRLKADNDYQCMKCKFPETGTTGSVTGKEFIALEAGASVECVNEFCYLGDMLGSGRGAGDASRMRVKCAWKKFRELSPILTTIEVHLSH